MEIKDDISLNDMINSIQGYCKKYDYYYANIPDSSVRKIYDYVINNIYTKPSTDIEYMYYGLYHQINTEHDKMIKYYTKAVQMRNSDAMNRLGKYYIKNQNDITGLYYLEKGIKKGNLYAMLSMGLYYDKIRDYEESKKYHMMAYTNSHLCDCKNTFHTKKNSCAHIKATIYLGYVYNILHDIENMKRYYEIAINSGYSIAMRKYGDYFSSINDHENVEKYYLMAYENEDTESFTKLYNYYSYNNMQKKALLLMIKYNRYDLYDEQHYKINDYILDDEMITELLNKPLNHSAPDILKYLYKIIKTQLDPIQLHFEYAENGKGYEDAKRHFISMVGGNK